MNTTLDLIKKAAKRLKSHFPDKSHMQRLDIAAYLIAGTSTYHEYTKSLEAHDSLGFAETNQNNTERDENKYSYSSISGEVPMYRCGGWNFYPESKAISHDSASIEEHYVGFLNKLSDTGNLLDFILQINAKRKKDADKWEECSPILETDEFIKLIDLLCREYVGTSIQDVYCPSGRIKNIDWNKYIS